MNKILLSVFLLIAIFSTCTTYAQKKDGIAPTPITATITASGMGMSFQVDPGVVLITGGG